MTVVLIPDAEQLVGAYLRDHPDVAALDARVAGRIPSSITRPWVRVTQLDAPSSETSRTEHLIGYLLQLDCYAGQGDGGQAQASRLARTVRAVLHALPDTQGLPGTVVTRARFTSMIRLPDEAFEPARERVVLDAEIFLHGLPA